MRELYAPELSRPKVLSAYRTDVWSLVLRSLSANFFAHVSDRCKDHYDPELSRPSFLSASLTNAWSPFRRSSLGQGFSSASRANAWSFLLLGTFGQAFCQLFGPMCLVSLLRNLFGQAFCPMFRPMRGVFRSGAPSAKGSARLSGQCVEPHASDRFRPSFLSGCLGDVWNLFAPELSRPKVLPAYRADAWSLLLRNLFGQVFARLSG